MPPSKSPDTQPNRPTAPITPHPPGTPLYKIFDNIQYRGYVQKFDPKYELYLVRYEDFDEEDLTHDELEQLLSPTKNKKIQTFVPDFLPSPQSNFTFRLDTHRLQRSQRQHFYLLNTASFSTAHNTVHILGYTGNEYVVTISNTITCSCPDVNPGCKHILFLLSLLGHNLDPTIPQVSICPSETYHRLSQNATGTLFQRHRLDSLANALCISHHSSQCCYCSKPLAGSLLICLRCGSANHTQCVRNVPSRPTACAVCHRPYYPIHSPSHNGYRNFYNVLDFFRYPVQSPTLPNKRLRQRSTTALPTLPIIYRTHTNTATAPMLQESPTTDVKPSITRCTKMDV